MTAPVDDREHSAIGRVLAYAIFGVLAGGLVYAVEAVDRLRVLRVNLDGAGEGARLALLTAASIPLVAVVAIGFGVFLVAADAVRRAVEPRLPARVERLRGVAALVVSAAMAAVVLRLISYGVPGLVENLVVRTIRRVDARLFSLGPIGNHPRIAFALGLSAVTLAILAFQWWLFSRRGPRAWLWSGLVAMLSVGLVVGGYAADSRIEFTRYEQMFHMPLEVLYGAAALVACVAIARAFGDPERVARSRVALAATGLLVALAAGSFVYGSVAMDSSQNVKALFWGRSILARRAFQLARIVTDRDGDGFSPYFGGGDLDDSSPSVHPLAAEVPGNGVDDNCIGGDLASADQPEGSLFKPASDAPAAPVAPSADGVRNVLILSIDCLRADHLSAYGYSRPTSPNIDRFAAESLLFENAYSQGTNTGHSFTSMYRSSYADDIFDERVPSFARLMRDRGYTAQFVNAIRTDAWLNANQWNKYREIMAEFDDVHDEGERFWNAETLTDRAIETIDQQPAGAPHLTWVHYFDCHRPRRRHAEHDFGRSRAGVFDSNVAYVDEHIGRLFDHLRDTGRLDNTIVFIIADHGEAFMEHGAVDHSNKPYNNNTLVPLIVRAPGVTPARFAPPCGLVDVGPTALGFVGAPIPEFYRGVDLVAAARGGGPPQRIVVSETPRNLIESSFYSWALVDWPYKILWDVRSNTTEVFDLATDPGEQRNLVDRDPALAARMRQTLGAWLDRETARTGAVGPGDEDLAGEGGD